MLLSLKRPSELCQKEAAVPADMLGICFAASSRPSEIIQVCCHHALGTRECSDLGGGLQTRVTCSSRLLAALVANPEPLPGKLTAMSLTVCASIRSCNVNVMLANARKVACKHARKAPGVSKRSTVNRRRRSRRFRIVEISRQTRFKSQVHVAQGKSRSGGLRLVASYGADSIDRANCSGY